MRKAIPQNEYKAKYAELSEAREKAEAMLGEHFFDEIYEQKPEVSKKRLYDYLLALFPNASEKQILKFMG